MTGPEARRQARALVEAATAAATAEWLAEAMAGGRSRADAEAEIDRSGPEALAIIDRATARLAELLRPVRPFGSRLADEAAALLDEMIGAAVEAGDFDCEGTQGEVYAQAGRVLMQLVLKVEELISDRLLYRAIPDATISKAMASVSGRLEQRRRTILRDFAGHVTASAAKRLRLQ